MGILLSKSLKTCNIFFPINDSDSPPIKVINITDKTISNPGTEKGK